MNKHLLTVLFGFFLISGCASVQPVQNGNLTPGMAKTTIIKGKTTQNEILTVFGAPNIVTKNKSGNEVWTYDKMSVESGASEVYGTAIVVGEQACVVHLPLAWIPTLFIRTNISATLFDDKL